MSSSEHNEARDTCDDVQRYIEAEHPDVVYFVLIGVGYEAATNSNGDPEGILKAVQEAVEKQKAQDKKSSN